MGDLNNRARFDGNSECRRYLNAPTTRESQRERMKNKNNVIPHESTCGQMVFFFNFWPVDNNSIQTTFPAWYSRNVFEAHNHILTYVRLHGTLITADTEARKAGIAARSDWSCSWSRGRSRAFTLHIVGFKSSALRHVPPPGQSSLDKAF